MRCTYGWLLLTICPALLAGTEWETHFNRGESLERNGRYQEAAVEFEAALRAGSELEAAVTRNNLGVVYRALGRERDAERCYNQAIAYYSDRPDHAVALATAVQNLAALDLTLGRLSKAEALYGQAYEIRRRLLPAWDPGIAESLQGLARLEQERHHPADAEKHYREALSIRETPAVVHNLASLLMESRRPAEARPLFERALVLYRAQSPVHPGAAVVLRYLAELDAQDGDTADADAEFRQAVAICERTLPPDHPQTGIILQAYGRFLSHTHRKKEGEAVSARAGRILSKTAMENGSAYLVDVESLKLAVSRQ